jgi:hypothetical protein
MAASGSSTSEDHTTGTGRSSGIATFLAVVTAAGHDLHFKFVCSYAEGANGRILAIGMIVLYGADHFRHRESGFLEMSLYTHGGQAVRTGNW